MDTRRLRMAMGWASEWHSNLSITRHHTMSLSAHVAEGHVAPMAVVALPLSQVKI